MAGDSLDPVGVWNCISYGDVERGNRPFMLRLGPRSSTAMARPRESGVRIWLPIDDWSVARGALTFSEPARDRRFAADLARSTLGGTWQTASKEGGWWCTRVAELGANDTQEGGETSDVLPPLITAVTATPSYPRQAIREAREGRAVVCFVVDPDGAVLDPFIVEISDPIFESPSLRAVSVSRYRGWEPARGKRPACRSFVYELDAIY